mmetsp:Transcript_123347/g.334934  ORF Transcript_123347/g.334934 Transcript_123347/m.334934 type:complete len:293 (-) Transcript_123347:87-965(-)
MSHHAEGLRGDLHLVPQRGEADRLHGLVRVRLPIVLGEVAVCLFVVPALAPERHASAVQDEQVGALAVAVASRRVGHQVHRQVGHGAPPDVGPLLLWAAEALAAKGLAGLLAGCLVPVGRATANGLLSHRMPEQVHELVADVLMRRGRRAQRREDERNPGPLCELHTLVEERHHVGHAAHVRAVDRDAYLFVGRLQLLNRMPNIHLARLLSFSMCGWPGLCQRAWLGLGPVLGLCLVLVLRFHVQHFVLGLGHRLQRKARVHVQREGQRRHIEGCACYQRATHRTVILSRTV